MSEAQVAVLLPEVKTSYSELSSHRGCPQRWYYSKMLGLSKKPDPSDPKVELHMGSWWHAMMAADSWQRAVKYGSLLKAPARIRGGHDVLLDTEQPLTPESVLLAAERTWLTLDPSEQEAWISKLSDTLPNRLSALYSAWLDRWESDRGHERPLAMEMGWSRPLTDGVKLVGYIDEVYLDTRRNLVVVRDHKTAKALGTQSALDDMMDSQLQLYAWGASPKITSWGHGSVQAMAYDRIKTVKPTTPRLNQSGSLSKQVTQFDLHTYREWVAKGQHYAGRAKDGSGAGVYKEEPAVVEHLTSPSWLSIWHQRTLVPLNVNMIRAHLRSALDTAADIARTRERALVEGAAARNLGGGCKYCDYAPLCRAQIAGGPDGEYPLDQYGLVHPSMSVLTGPRENEEKEKEMQDA
jgi:RecB family exonuclease